MDARAIVVGYNGTIRVFPQSGTMRIGEAMETYFYRPNVHTNPVPSKKTCRTLFYNDIGSLVMKREFSNDCNTIMSGDLTALERPDIVPKSR